MPTNIKIELFSASNCSRCVNAKKQLQNMINEIANCKVDYYELNVIDKLDYAVSLGVLITPAIAINGELIFSAMPTLKQLQKELNKYLDEST